MSAPSVRRVAPDGSWHRAIAAAAREGADWLWLVDAGVEPDDGALAALLAVLDDLGELPPPVLLAGKVVDARGELDRRSAPWPPLHDRAVAIAAATRRLAAIRLARWGSLLVSTEAVAKHGPPRADLAGGADDIEWTARLLRGSHGYLVPASVAVRLAGTTPSRLREARDRARILRSPAWGPHEAAWFAYASARELAGARRSPSRTPRATVRTLAGWARLTRT